MKPSEKKIIAILGIAVACVFLLLILLLAQDFLPSPIPASLPAPTPEPLIPTIKPTPSPSPTVDIHLHDELCADMRALEVERQAIRQTIMAEKDFIERSEQIIERRILPEKDREKAKKLMSKVDHYMDLLLYDYKFGILWDQPKYPNLPEEIKKWVDEDCYLHGFLRDELMYFTLVGEEREQYERVLEITDEEALVPLSEYTRRTLLQDHAYEQLMERYCQ